MMTTDVEEMRDDGYGRQGKQAEIAMYKRSGRDVGQRGHQQ